MKNIIDICNKNIPNSLHSLYEASLLDIDGTIEDGDVISDFEGIISELMSSSSENKFSDTLNKLIITIKSTFKKFEANDLKQYYSGKFDRSQIFIAIVKDTNSYYKNFKEQLHYCDSNKSGKLYWNEEPIIKRWNGPANAKGIILYFKQNINNYCKTFDFYMVPEYIHDEFKNLMKNRK